MKKLFLCVFVLMVFSACAAQETDIYNVETEIPAEEFSEKISENFPEEPPPENYIAPLPAREAGILEVYVFGLENADAILITTENYVVMIDAGENQHGAYIMSHFFERGISRVDYLIITHFHRDHVGGAHHVINNFAVGEIIVPNYRRESRSVSRFRAAKENAGIEAAVLTENIHLTLDDAEFTIMPSGLEFFFFGYDGDTDDDDELPDAPRENDFSIVVTVVHGENSFIFTGDAMQGRLRELLRDPEIGGFDVLKVPHHGRHNRRSVEFLEAAAPRIAIITDCNLRPADGRILAALADAEIFFSKNGGILIGSDGTELTVEQ